jgi:hypothetical protein
LDGSSKGSCAAQHRVAPAAENAPDGVQDAGQPVDTDTLLAAINAISNTVEERIVIAVRDEVIIEFFLKLISKKRCERDCDVHFKYISEMLILPIN